MDFYFLFAFELYHSLFHILMIKSSYRVDRALSNLFFNSLEILKLVVIGFDHTDMKETIQKRVYVESFDSSSSDF